MAGYLFHEMLLAVFFTRRKGLMKPRVLRCLIPVLLLSLVIWSCGTTEEAGNENQTGEKVPGQAETKSPVEPRPDNLTDSSPATGTVESAPDKDVEPAVKTDKVPSPPAKTPVKKAPPPVKKAAAFAAALLDPSLANVKAPGTFKVRFVTSKGPFIVEAVRAWSPKGVDRFYNLVKIGYFRDIAFFRVLDGFVVQFGISGDTKINEKWINAGIQDEPVKESNRRGYITYAKGGPNSRTTQLFINLVDNVNLDRMGFPAFGRVVEGMSVVDSLYSGYGEGAPRGRGPAQNRIYQEGNSYLKKSFPKLDYITKASILD